MMFSATMPDDLKKVCKKFLQNEVDIFIDEGKLILHGLAQFFIYIQENKKFEKLTHLLDSLAFNQTIIFVNRVDRAKKLTELLTKKLFNPICIHSGLKQQERIKNYDSFKANGSRLLVATDLFGRGIDIERVNLVINYGTCFLIKTSPTKEILICIELEELADSELKDLLLILLNLKMTPLRKSMEKRKPINKYLWKFRKDSKLKLLNFPTNLTHRSICDDYICFALFNKISYNLINLYCLIEYKQSISIF